MGASGKCGNRAIECGFQLPLCYFFLLEEIYLKENILRKFQTSCGGVILVPAKAETHLQAHPEIQKHLPDAIKRITLPPSGFMSVEVDMGKVIGRKGLVQTTEVGIDSLALFSRRVDREKPSRVAPLGSVGEEVNTIVILAFPDRVQEKTYILGPVLIQRNHDMPYDCRTENIVDAQ